MSKQEVTVYAVNQYQWDHHGVLQVDSAQAVKNPASYRFNPPCRVSQFRTLVAHGAEVQETEPLAIEWFVSKMRAEYDRARQQANKALERLVKLEKAIK